MNRREFLKTSAITIASTSTLLSACRSKKESSDKTDRIDGLGKMTYRYNPNNGDKVSLLGFGMMRLPIVGGGSARENPDAEIDQEAVNTMVDYAIEHGVNYFDTSPAYCQGRSEQSTGIALSRHPRNHYYIATKLSNFSPSTWSKVDSRQIFENSLKELQVSYVDYLLLHGIGMSAPDKDAMTAFKGRYIDNGMLDWLVEQKQKGRIRNLGFSYHGDISVFNMLLKWHDEGKYHWDFVQIELNYLDWRYANEINPRNTDAEYLYAELEKRGIMSVIMEPLLGGKLAYQPENIMLQMKSREPQSSAARWALRYAGTPEKVLTVLSGMNSMDHLIENVDTYSPLRPINEEENRFLLNLAEDLYNLKTIPCTACNYCMPCPYGLNIPLIFAYYNRCMTDGGLSMPDDPSNKDFLRLRKKFLLGYDRNLSRYRQADHCIGCNHCVAHCPQQISIPEEMHRINKFVEQLKQA